MGNNGNIVQMIGKRFGYLTAVKRVARPPNRSGKSAWYLFSCDYKGCGKTKKIDGVSVRTGSTSSCGCLHAERQRITSRTHGHTSDRKRPPEYRAWTSIIQRCENPNNDHYPAYGGRGIRVCDEWRKSYPKFLAAMGPRPPGTTIDRINNNGNYEPGNCHWATNHQQIRNTRRNIRITHNGKTMILADWAIYYGFNSRTIRSRMNRGATFLEAISRPVKRERS